MPSRHERRPEVGVDIPTPAQMRAMLAGATERQRPLMIVAAFTGLRASELRALTWGNVDFRAKLVRVRERANISGKIGSLKSGAAYRDIPIGPTVVNTLKAWKLACPNGPRVFPGRGGGIMCHNTTMALLNGRAHRFRHFFASWLIDQGFGPKRVQTLMGHGSIQITFDIYGHLFPQENDHDRFAAGELAVVGS